ncbi:MAG: YbjN domain-containing protein [Oscillospiraceae bacterium]
MIFQATQEIYDAMIEADLKCRIQENDESSAVTAGVRGDNTDFDILFISRDNDADASLRIFNIAKFPAEKMPAVCAAVNECNGKYRYLRFTADDDNTVTAAYDFPVNTENVGKGAVELCMRAMNIVDECYPVIMKAIYS